MPCRGRVRSRSLEPACCALHQARCRPVAPCRHVQRILALAVPSRVKLSTPQLACWQLATCDGQPCLPLRKEHAWLRAAAPKYQEAASSTCNDQIRPGYRSPVEGSCAPAAPRMRARRTGRRWAPPPARTHARATVMQRGCLVAAPRQWSRYVAAVRAGRRAGHEGAGCRQGPPGLASRPPALL